MTGFRRASALALGTLLTVSACADPAGSGSSRAFADLTASGFHSCGISGAGQVYCWGANSVGQLGNGSTSDSAAPQQVQGGRVLTGVSAGSSHSCAVGANGDVLCWGDNTYGQLGGGGAGSSTTPVSADGGSQFVSVSAGSAHTCALAANGVVWCWGSNRAGQLGDSTFVSRSTPAVVPSDARFTAVTAGGYHTCALAGDGVAWCWGDNQLGEVGDGSFALQRIGPSVVFGDIRFRSLSAGFRFTCGVSVDGEAMCWGDDVSGQLGVGQSAQRCTGLSIPCSRVPLPVSGGRTYRSASAGGFHACAVAADGTTWCWGDNLDGQLGAPDAGEVCASNHPCSSTPVSAPLLGAPGSFSVVRAGYLHTCALAPDGAWCWGNNVSGQLGDGTRDMSASPVRVTGQP